MATLNVQTDYGAAGDGVTDDTSEINQAIIDAGTGDTVFLPAGTYRVNFYNRNSGNGQGAVQFYGPTGLNDVTFEGEGNDSVIEMDPNQSLPSDNFRCIILEDGDSPSQMEGLTLRNFRMEGRRDALGSDQSQKHCIATNGTASGVTFEDIYIHDTYGTAVWDDFDNTVFRRITIDGADHHGIGPKGSTSNYRTIENCYFTRTGLSNSGYYGIDFNTGSGEVVDCVFENQYRGAKWVNSTGDLTFRRCRVEDNDIVGLGDFGSTGGINTNITLEDCVINNNGRGVRHKDDDGMDIPAGAEVIVNNNSGGVGTGFQMSADATLECDGTLYCFDNESTEFAAESTNSGYVSQLNTNGSVVSGGVSIQSQGSTRKDDLSNVPTASEVGAWSGDVGLTVSTEAASSIGETVANMNGNLDSLGDETDVDVYFEWGEEGAGFTNSTSSKSRTSTGSFTEQVSGLSSGTTYQYRAVADGVEESSTGDTVTFTTDVEIVDNTWWTNFEDETVGNMPSGWTEEWGTTDIFDVIDTNPVEGNRTVRHQSKSSGENDAISYDDPGITSEVDVVALVYVPAHASSSTGSFTRPTVRGDEESGTNIGMTVDLYDVEESGSFTPQWRMLEYPFDVHTTWTDPVPQENTWYLIRLDAEGSTFRAKTWEYGTSEPSTWDAEVTSSSVPDTGWVGWSQYGEHETWLDFFSVGTGADSAPLPSDVGDPTTITTDFSEYL